MDTKQLKLLTLKDAVAQIEDGMTLGIGTGSTIELLIPEIAKLMEQGYQFTRGMYFGTNSVSSENVEYSNLRY